MNNTGAIILAVCLFIIMFGMGLSLTLADFKRIIQRPKAILIGLLNQVVLLPIIGYLILMFFDVRPEIAVGIMILAAAPGGPTSNLISHLAKGDTALSVSLTAFSSLITIISLPFIVQFALVEFMGKDQSVQLNIPEIIAQLMVITVIPVALGMLINNKKETFARKMDKPVKIASGVVLALVIVGLIVKEKAKIGGYFADAGMVALLLNIATMLVGFFTAKILKLNRAESVSISIESGIQNGTLAIAVATGVLANTEFAIAPSIYSLLMFLTGFAVIFISSLNKSQG